MTWGILLAVCFGLALLGQIRLGIRGEYTRQGAGVWLRVGRFQRKIYPRNPKESAPGGTESQGRSAQPQRESTSDPILSPHGMFQLGKRLFPVLWEGGNAVRHRLQVDVLQLEIIAGGQDPAEAAERYGQIHANLGALWQPVTQGLHVQEGRIHVGVDFDWGKTALYGAVSLSLTARQLLWLGLRYGPKCLNIFLEVRKQEKAVRIPQRKAA